MNLELNHYLKGIKSPQTQVTIDGTKSHEKEEVYEKEHFTFEPVTEEGLKDLTKDIEFAREGLFTRYQGKAHLVTRSFRFCFMAEQIKLCRSKGTLIIEDSKYPASKDKYLVKYEPFDDQKLQTLLYLNSFL